MIGDEKKIETFLHNRLGRSMLLSTLCKPVGMIISFLYTPLLLNYLGNEAYGVWSTILSIINWINYFDVGIGNGLRNQLAKDITNDDKGGAHASVSTAYIVLATISGIVLVVGSIVIWMLNCTQIFNTSIKVKPALYVSFVFICFNFVLSLSKVQLYALQQAEKVGFMTVLVQLINLISIVCLSFFGRGNILAVAIVIGLSGLIVNIVFTGKVWSAHLELIPHLHGFDRSKLSVIGSLGIKFFVIQIAALVLYTTDNMIITQLFGPSYVTPYNTAYTAFGIVNGLFSAMMLPLWSKYTVAMETKDFKWINMMILKLDMLLIPIGVILLLGGVWFDRISVIWLRKELNYEPNLILFMGIYYFVYIAGTIYSTALNGMGKVNLQMGLSVFVAVLNIPLSVFLGKNCGMNSAGVLMATVICMLITEIPIIISVHMYLSKRIKS